MVEIRNSLKFKFGIYLLITLTIAVFVFSMVLVRNNREALLQQVIRNSAQLSQVVIKSTRFAMLQNKPSHVNQIIQDVGDQQQIEKVRILSKDGTIIHSSKREEIGIKVDQKAESCLACHMDEKARKASPQFGRSRFFTSDNGKRMLGSTAVIPNQASCAGAGCHASPDDETVLGVLDIIYPLDEIEATLRSNTYTVFGWSFAFIILASLLVSHLINRMVYLPLRDLDDGADKLAAGDLENRIPVRSKDELGHLASSFNSMTEALQKSRVDLEEWGRTLEKKVADARKELEVAHAEAARSEKLASVGLLAAGIAHELNNPLTGVLTFAHLVRKNLPDDSRDAEDLDLVIRETKRCATIIRRLLDFSREKTPEKAYGDLNAIITDTLKLVEQPTQVEDIELITDLDENLPLVWLDENLIKQVIMNMLVNARHAIGRGGSITIRTRLRQQEECPESIADAGDFAEITIVDNGCGIPEKDLQRVFDPFFTTKDVGSGTGLGLSVSYGTVESHRGTIEVDSIEGEGTEFRIYLAINKKNDLGTGL
jgi:two-component system NtrC family sensor kinase